MDQLTLLTDLNADRHAALAGAWLASYRSSHTIRAYRRDLTDTFLVMDSWGIDALAAERRHIDAWRLQLTGEPSTIARKIAALSSFYRYAVSAGEMERNPVELVRRPKVDGDHSTTQGMSLLQAQSFLDHARKEDPRAHAFASLLLYTGIRLDEGLGADLVDLRHDAGHRVLVVTRKGGKRQKIVLPAQVVDALGAYLGQSVAEGTGLMLLGDNTTLSRPIFVTATGRRWAPSEAYRTIRRLAAKAGVPGALSPHSLRHTHATLALEAGVSLADLQDSMGHADPRSTRRYDRSRGRLERASSHAVAVVLH